MLIKSEVKRRAQTLNTYILSLKERVFNHKYKDACDLLKSSRESINNSYMAPYDPNTYLFDSLKTKNEKLRIEKETIEQQLVDKQSQINKLKAKRGYTRSNHPKEESQVLVTSGEFIPKMEAKDISVYASRLALKLEDVEKIYYESVTLETDFHVFRIVFDGTVTSIPFTSIISDEAEDIYELICWRGEKSNNHSYMIIKFNSEEERKIWSRCLTFSKLICECEYKSQLFFKEDNVEINIKESGNILESKPSVKEIKEVSEKHSHHKYSNVNLHINNSKYSNDRFRRKSEFNPTINSSNRDLGLLINRSRSRKASASEEYALANSISIGNKNKDKKVLKKSEHSSFDDGLSLSNSFVTKKEPIQKEIIKPNLLEVPPSSSIERLIEEREKLKKDKSMSKSKNSQSREQIFFNDSSIHWIDEQNDDDKSRSSDGSKNILSEVDTKIKVPSAKQSSHISEVPPEIEESPLLPHNLREKKRNDFRVSPFEVPFDSKSKLGKENSENSGSKKDSAKMEKNSYSNELQDEDDLDEDDIDRIDSMTEENYDDSGNNEKKANGSNLEMEEDKSLDLMSDNEDSETESKKYSLESLRNGLKIYKCSVNGVKARLKKLALSNNLIEVNWKNEDHSDLKKVKISEIRKIEMGTATPGIKKHIKKAKKERCMAIRCVFEGENKTLEFYLPEDQDLEVLEKFYEKLNSYVKYKNINET